MAKKMFDIKPPVVNPSAAMAVKKTVKPRVKKATPVKEVLEQSVIKEPVVKESAVDRVVSGGPVYKKPIYQEPIYQEPVYKEPSNGADKLPKEKRFPLKTVLACTGVLLILIVVAVAMVKLPKADVAIWPKQDTLTLFEKVTASKAQTTPDLTKKIIPARYLEETKDESGLYQATGSASNDGKASGTIKVYNKNDSAFTLIKGTHFLSDSGKYFVTLERISIPGKKGSTAGSVNVNVQSEESGEAYNIGPSKFSAPKLSGTSYYYTIWGESTSAMTGGKTGTVKKVTDDDIKQAKDSLTKKLVQDAKDTLKSKLGPDDILLDGAIESSVIETKADVKSGTVQDTFNESAKIKVSALVFSKQDMEKLLMGDITAQLPTGSKFRSDTLEVNYVPQTTDMQGGKLMVSAQPSVKTYYDIKTDDLLDMFGSKNSDQIKEVVDQMYMGKIAELKVKFWPFWVHKAPNDKNRIKVNINF